MFCKGLANGMIDDAIADDAPIDEEVLDVGLCAMGIGMAEPALQMHIIKFLLEVESFFQKACATYFGDPLGAVAIIFNNGQLERMIRERVLKCNVEPTEGEALQGGENMPLFRFIATKKSPASGKVEKEVTH